MCLPLCVSHSVDVCASQAVKSRLDEIRNDKTKKAITERAGLQAELRRLSSTVEASIVAWYPSPLLL